MPQENIEKSSLPNQLLQNIPAEQTSTDIIYPYDSEHHMQIIHIL